MGANICGCNDNILNDNETNDVNKYNSIFYFSLVKNNK